MKPQALSGFADYLRLRPAPVRCIEFVDAQSDVAIRMTPRSKAAELIARYHEYVKSQRGAEEAVKTSAQVLRVEHEKRAAYRRWSRGWCDTGAMQRAALELARLPVGKAGAK